MCWFQLWSKARLEAESLGEVTAYCWGGNVTHREGQNRKTNPIRLNKNSQDSNMVKPNMFPLNMKPKHHLIHDLPAQALHRQGIPPLVSSGDAHGKGRPWDGVWNYSQAEPQTHLGALPTETFTEGCDRRQKCLLRCWFDAFFQHASELLYFSVCPDTPEGQGHPLMWLLTLLWEGLEAPVESRFACEHSKQGRKGGAVAGIAAPGRGMGCQTRAGSAQRGWQCPEGLAGGEVSPQPLGCPSPPPASPHLVKPALQRQPGDDAALPSSGSCQPKAISVCSH